MKDKRLILKIVRLSLHSFLLLGVVLAFSGVMSKSWIISVSAMLLPIIGLALYEYWKNVQLKKFDDSYPTGFNLLYTDKEGVRKSATVIRFENDKGRVLLKEIDMQSNEVVYIMPISSFIAKAVAMREDAKWGQMSYKGWRDERT